MLSEEITSHGALAPLTGCKLKSLYILKGQLSNNFYCLQSDFHHCPAELPWLTLVQRKSEAQQSAEVDEVHMTSHTSVHHIHGALSSPRLPAATKWAHTWQGKRAYLGMEHSKGNAGWMQLWFLKQRDHVPVLIQLQDMSIYLLQSVTATSVQPTFF